jgi:hypothetical protein
MFQQTKLTLDNLIFGQKKARETTSKNGLLRLKRFKILQSLFMITITHQLLKGERTTGGFVQVGQTE